jgi:hypothetical protein
MKGIFKYLVLLILALFDLSLFGQTNNIWSEEPPDNLKNLKFMTPAQLNQEFLSSQKLPAFSAVLRGLQKRGFEKLKMKEGNWGFTGEFNAGNGVFEKSKFLAFDFYNPKAGKGGQGASIIIGR